MDPIIGLVRIESATESHERLRPIASATRRLSGNSKPSIEATGIHLPPATIEVPIQAAGQSNGQNGTKLQGAKALILAIQLTTVMMLNSFITGTMTIAITVIASDLSLEPSLIYWPVLAYTLTSSPLMLPFGSIADVLGAKPINLVGTLGCGVFVLASGLVNTGEQLIAVRCMQGVASALSLPTSMGIISSSLAAGKLRNLALSCLGLGQVIGYALGLVLSGIFVDTIGWRFGFWLCGGVQIALFALGIWSIPKTTSPYIREGSVLYHLKTDIDWVGAAISCACIGLLSYVLAMIAESTTAIKQPANIALLSLSVLLMPAFSFWMSFQERRGRPALMPNSLWKTTFVSLCIMVTFTYAEMMCMELLTSLFFQNIQHLSPLQSSIRLLPGLVVGAVLNLTMGSLVHRLSIPLVLTTGALMAAVSPLLMALVNPNLPYWYQAFPAQVLYPVCVDPIFVVGALIVSDIFPERDQALAGAVFTTVGNIGQAIGLAIIAVISNTVTSNEPDPTSSDALLQGYKAAFFTSFAWMIATAVVAMVGFRKVGRIGLKRD